MRKEIMNGKLVVLCQKLEGERPEFYLNSDIIRVHEGESEDSPLLYSVYPAGVSYEYEMPIFEGGVQVDSETVILDAVTGTTVIQQAKECGLDITSEEMLDRLISNEALFSDEVSVFMISNSYDEECAIDATELKGMKLSEIYNKIAYIESELVVA